MYDSGRAKTDTGFKSDFDSVRAAAQQINLDPSIAKIDEVINNAGVLAIPEYTLDKQGIEMTFSANHLGHFLLTNLIMPKILAARPGSRIVNVTSRGHRIGPVRFVRFDDYNFGPGESTYDPWSAYGQSKTANILFSVELARRLSSSGGSGIQTNAVHPGGIWETSLTANVKPEDFLEVRDIAKRNNGGRDVFIEDNPLKTVAQGTAPLIAAALDPAFNDKSPCFIENCQVGEALEYALDAENAARLWELSERLVGQKFEH